VKYIISLIILIGFWNCDSNPKPLDNIEKPDTAKPMIVIDSLNYYNYNIDSVWLQSDFDSAVAVILDGSRDIMDVSKMDKKYSASSKRTLNELQLKSIAQNLSGKVPSSYTPADCFQPYHGFFFYKKGKINARLAICFSCGTYFSKPKNSGGIDYQLTKKIYQDLGLPIYNWDDSTEVQNSVLKYSDLF
jgi:hypothetical protein